MYLDTQVLRALKRIKVAKYFTCYYCSLDRIAVGTYHVESNSVKGIERYTIRKSSIMRLSEVVQSGLK
jgi:hypothetical protein